MITNESISVCIASYNGAAKLPLTIPAILSNSVLPKEIIVFLDGSKDDSLKYLESLKNPLLKVIQSQNKGRASARNAAIEAAESEIILVLDDDIIIPESTIQEHLKFHSTNARAILTCPTLTKQNSKDFSNFKRFLETQWNSLVDLEKDTTFAAAFFSIKKNTFNDIGQFHTGLNDAEDYEFGIRTKRTGVTISMNPYLVGIHNDPMSCKYFIQRNRQYRQANEFLVTSNILDENKYVPKKPKLLKKLLFFFLTSNLLVKLIDRNVFKFVYKPWRYRFYDYVSAGFIYYFPNKRLK